MTALEAWLHDVKCLELAILLLYASKGARQGQLIARISLRWITTKLLWDLLARQLLESNQGCLPEWKTWGFCNACYCLQPCKGLGIKKMLLLYNPLKKSLEAAWRRGECALFNITTSRVCTEGSITLQVKIFVFLLCLPSKNLTAIWFSSVLVIDFSWMLGWELF